MSAVYRLPIAHMMCRRPGKGNFGSEGGSSKDARKEGLYPIQALVQAIALRFKFHFEGTRQTNRLDKVSSNLCAYPRAQLTTILTAGVVLHTYRQRVS